MLTRESYKMFLARIVHTHLPDEKIAFDLDCDAMVDSIWDREWAGQEEGHGHKLGAADLLGVTIVLNIAFVAFGTYKLLAELQVRHKERKAIDGEELRRVWEKILGQQGVAPVKASVIARDFVRDLVALTEP